MRLYTQTELALNREAGENRGRLLTALWVHGKGPRGGKVNIGQARYDALNLLVIENKAQVVARFTATPHYAELNVVGLVIRFPKVKESQKAKVYPKAKDLLPSDEKPPWEE